MPPASPPAAARPHIGSLDFLRGFAALSVCLFHFTLAGTPYTTNPFSWGYLGVEIFFVISGFIIPYSLSGTHYWLRDFGRYYWKRMRRICPPAYFSIGLIMLKGTIAGYFLHRAPVWLQPGLGSRLLSNALFLVPFTRTAWFNGVFWTLALEFQFYAVVGVLFNRLFTRPTLLRFLGIGVALCAPHYILPYLLRFPPENYFHFNAIFMLGGATFLFRQGKFNRRAYAIALLVFAALTCTMLTPLIAATAVVTALLIAFVQLQHPVFRFFGKISYSLYLTHALLNTALTSLLSRFLDSATTFGYTSSVALRLLITLLVASLFYKVVEKPFMPRSQRLALRH